MDSSIRQKFNEFSSKEDKLRMDALQTILHITDEKVDWVYEVWDDLLQKLDDENSFQRSIAIMVLCNLAKSDSENRMKGIIDRLLIHTRDEKFITSRQCLQNIWKTAIVDPTLKEKILAHLEIQYKNCTCDQHYNLIRQDILQSMKTISGELNESTILEKAYGLAQMEENVKYRKKFLEIFA